MRQWLRYLSLRSVLFYGLALLFLPPFVACCIILVLDHFRVRRRLQGHFVSLRHEPVIDMKRSRVQLYTYGQDLYDAMLYSIHQARQIILFETFIWKGDRMGQRFKDALLQAAQRGVAVYVIYDAFANLVVPKAFKQFPPTIHVLPYPLFSLPWNPLSLSSYARDHRKILVVDGEVAFVGGYNIGDTYATQWRDTHARIVGSGALEVENVFIDFWNYHRRTYMHLPSLPNLRKREWDAHLNVHRNEPPMLMFPIRDIYLEAIDKASRRIYLTQAYFMPDRIFLRVLEQAARRGVDVRILLPASSNHVLADWLSRGYYTECLRAGMHLLLYQKAMVHAKTATIDGIWSTVGTANLDRLSLVGNYEVNVEFFDEHVARQMEKIFLEDEKHVHELTLDEWEQRPLLQKMLERMIRRLRPLF